MELNTYRFLVIFPVLFLNVIAQQSSCTTTTTETICNGSLWNVVNTNKYQCSAHLFSSFELPSCNKTNSNDTIYWFSYDDLCRDNKTRSNYFAAVNPDDTFTCMNRPYLSIQEDYCRINYNATTKSMIIMNMTNTTSQYYFCSSGRNYLNILLNIGIIYSINVLDTTTSTPPNTNTPFLSNSTTAESNPVPLWAIIVPSVLGSILLILILIIGYLCCRKWKRTTEPDDYSLEAMSSRSDTSSNKDYGDVYRVSSRNLDTGYDDMVWQRVQRKY